MKKLSSKQVRRMWLDFWKSKGHEEISSKSLIPVNDPSLLWINSGVATLKDFFSGKKIPNNPRITNSQKSIRTNDIENVGVTARHHTFFEMLGNFSIGDYFKDDAIKWAYEILFDIFQFEKEHIYITYFEEDIETYDKWIEAGIKKDHLIKGNRDMNFWDVGQGPCGPDTEIFFDRGNKYDPENIGLELLIKDLENDRYVEIWNIVFSQYNNDGNNNYSELAQKNIDTGAGLERIVSIFQDAPTNFDTDLFLPIIKKIEILSGSKYEVNNYFVQNKEQTKINKNFRIIADHIRAIAIAIQDGATPSNTSRGYIIRRLIRRAYRAGLQIGIKTETFLTLLTPVVVEVLDIFEINEAKVNEIILKEEIAFGKTIKQGEELVMKSIKGKKHLDFEIAFKLFETYGFPIELTQEILSENGITLDIKEFDEYKERHANVSRGNTKNTGMESQIQIIQEIDSLKSKFVGYQNLEINTKIIFSKQENDKFYTLTENTPFYPTGGGQEKDKGYINDVVVVDVFKDKYGNIWHITESAIDGSEAIMSVSKPIRLNKERNHSSTHLLGKALRNVLGDHIVQLGSYNDEYKLRFDFPSKSKPSSEEIKQIENEVNQYIKEGHSLKYIETTFEEAKKLGAITLEGEDYGDDVRVVDFGISKEFCGGTHVSSTSLIEKFKIIKLESKGSGVFRIEAITSNENIDKYESEEKKKLLIELNKIINKNKEIDSKYKIIYGDSIEDLSLAIEKAKLDNKTLKKKAKNVSIDISGIEPIEKDGTSIYESLNEDTKVVKNKAILLREKFPNSLIIIGAKTGNGSLIAIASKKFNANEELKSRFKNIKGGGNETFAMGNIIEVE